jgi:hypothetical protein
MTTQPEWYTTLKTEHMNILKKFDDRIQVVRAEVKRLRNELELITHEKDRMKMKLEEELNEKLRQMKMKRRYGDTSI